MHFRVDDAPTTHYTARIPAPLRWIAALVPIVATTLLACAARTEPPAAPVVREFEQEAMRAALPEQPLRIIFDWQALERDARFNGKGAARVQGPEHARLDLFGPRGDSYLSAAVVQGEIRLPPAVETTVIPPPALLWGALGVFVPPAGGELVATVRDGERTRLDYRDGAEKWRFELVGERLRRVEWTGANGAKKTVELKGEGAYRLPAEALYRDWATFTELKLKVSEVEAVDAFSPDTWRPDAA